MRVPLSFAVVWIWVVSVLLNFKDLERLALPWDCRDVDGLNICSVPHALRGQFQTAMVLRVCETRPIRSYDSSCAISAYEQPTWAAISKGSASSKILVRVRKDTTNVYALGPLYPAVRQPYFILWTLPAIRERETCVDQCPLSVIQSKRSAMISAFPSVIGSMQHSGQKMLIKVIYHKLRIIRNLFSRTDFAANVLSISSKILAIKGPRYAFRNLSSPLAILVQEISVDLRDGERFDARTWKEEDIGGGMRYTFSRTTVIRSVVNGYESRLSPVDDAVYVFSSHVDGVSDPLTEFSHGDLVPIRMSLDVLVNNLNMGQLLVAVRIHGIKGFGRHAHIDSMRQALLNHSCPVCTTAVTLVRAVRRNKNDICDEGELEAPAVKTRPANVEEVPKLNLGREPLTAFPPPPTTAADEKLIISDWCDAIIGERLREVGCAVCGQLVKECDASLLDTMDPAGLDLLESGSRVTRKERFRNSEPIVQLQGPVLAAGCKHVCTDCNKSLDSGKLPMVALANNLWLGEVPEALEDLYFAEKMLIAKIRHNRCVVRVKSGMRKMCANAIAFANPTVHVYDTLPPPRAELDDVISFIFVGPTRPTSSDLARTPMLVRRDKVARALEWLTLNNEYYADLTISYENLEQYEQEGCPVTVAYREKEDVVEPAAQSADQGDSEEGTADGRCALIIQGVVGGDFGKESWEQMTAEAVKHLAAGGGTMGISHHESPESIYHNPGMYPQMFPWLFPYGKGGLDQPCHFNALGSGTHKRWMLMYWDKRFQTDPHFPIIALNHEQIKDSVTGGYVMVKKKDFKHVSDRLMNLDMSVMSDLSRRLQSGQRVENRTAAQNLCFQVMHDIDLIGKHVQGSRTSKKFMRNEIWSMIEFQGSPSWFITFAPADSRSPICLYYADQDVEFKPEILSEDERFRLIAENPVAGARFFHFVVTTFLKTVLGVGEERLGLFGETSGFYGTVEQQGRLTLHLHLLLWIRGALTPQEIRDRIMEPDGIFRKSMVLYLESMHKGEFQTGELLEVQREVAARQAKPGYQDPTLTQAKRPPPTCTSNCGDCEQCERSEKWADNVARTTDDILLRSNVHECGKRCYPNGRSSCKSRFPRDIVAETMVDPESGALNMKKKEAKLNTFNYTLTYLLRSNTDVTSLLSGTALKAVVAYVSEYVTKVGLKTYGVIDIIKSVFDKNTELLGGTADQHNKSRKIMTQVVNSLTSKSEIGGPMAAMYLLGNPDHYNSHRFVPCYWRNYVREARKYWDTGADSVDATNGGDGLDDDKVVLGMENGSYVGLSRVDDYTMRPKAYEHVPLYTWIRLSRKVKMSKRRAEKCMQDVQDKDDSDSPDSSKSEASDVSEVESERETIKKSSAKGELFTAGHAQRRTHAVYLEDDDGLSVPNFIGGNLPRSDKGDREAYCATMLALFKPWRSGKDLKSEEDSWDDAFEKCDFDDVWREKMKYFNVKYECTDARDDFHAQQKESEGLKSGGVLDQEIGSGDYENDFETGIDQYVQDLFEMETNESIRYRRKLKRDIDEIKLIMVTSGWLDDCLDGKPDVWMSPGGPEIYMAAGRWQNAVQAKRQSVLQERGRHLKTSAKRGRKNIAVGLEPGEVAIVGREFLNKKFRAALKPHQTITDNIVHEFRLNEAQERAFRIVANHANDLTSNRLQMYLGGMGGTGKSTVIKALEKFFGDRNEAHRFLIVAPTGAAAALLNGSTYHSVFGINDRNDGERANQVKHVAQIRTSLDGVEYVFLDEVSMLGCRSMYQISAAAARALGITDEAFGGLNMIFAGDFAQLAPVRAQALYSGSVGHKLDGVMSLKEQEEAIGKALWHQTTTVVILRQNMRQNKQSLDDGRLRKALENMRYKSCTDEDVAYLRSRIAGRGPTKPKLAQKRFRNVSVITARNLQKDEINRMGAHRFAAENNLELKTFFSIDHFKTKNYDLASKQGRKEARGANDSYRRSDSIPLAQQNEIWDLMPSHSNHIPGRLDLCVGMPVMIRYNEATECCITKGAEATVVGWDSSKGPHGKEVLDTLFVELKNPPKTVQIEGLKPNVVPLTRRSDTVTCTLTNSENVTISRSQVAVLINFAMTDYSSQGRTRPENPVDLQNCVDHLSYYTALSRSATSEGTIIVQGFEKKHIQGGLSGYLRQEFRELELMDEITGLTYEGILPREVYGVTRGDYIRRFRTWKGKDYVPQGIHKAIAWSKSDPFREPAVTSQIAWQFSVDNKKSKVKRASMTRKKRNETFYVPAIDGNAPTNGEPLPIGGKRKIDSIEEIDHEPEGSLVKIGDGENVPKGMKWDPEDWSCCYDSVFSIMWNLWLENDKRWTTTLRNMNDHTKELATGFRKHMGGKILLETARDRVRGGLNKEDPGAFPYGKQGSKIYALVDRLSGSKTARELHILYCRGCGWEEASERERRIGVDCPNESFVSTQAWVSNHCLHKTARTCRQCGGEIYMEVRWREKTDLLFFNLGDAGIAIDKVVRVPVERDSCSLSLRGVVYSNGAHYTSRLVDKKGMVWFHDGIKSNKFEGDGELRNYSENDLKTCENGRAVVVVYGWKARPTEALHKRLKRTSNAV